MVGAAAGGPSMVAERRPAARQAQGPLVSIVLPTYNGQRHLAESIASCLGQTYPNLELLVVDDGSSVDIRGIVEAAGDARVRYLSHPQNKGLSTALNTGFAASRGNYLTWTSDDNRYHPTAIERMVEYLEAHPEIGLVYAGCRLIDEKGLPGDLLPAPSPERLWEMNCVRACFLYRRHVHERVGAYDPEVPLVEDYDYWVRTARLFRLGRVDEILYDFRVHPASLTGTQSLEPKRLTHLRVLAKLRESGAGAPISRSLWRQARAGMHATYGRAFFLVGRTRLARRDLLAAILLQPSNVRCWTIVGPLLKSLLGDRLLRAVRDSRWCRNPRPSST